MQRGSRQFKRVNASVKSGVEAMQKLEHFHLGGNVALQRRAYSKPQDMQKLASSNQKMAPKNVAESNRTLRVQCTRKVQCHKESTPIGHDSNVHRMLGPSTTVDEVECHNCHTENNRKRCFCRKCGIRLIHSYG